MSEWREVPLGEVLTLQRGFDLPANKRSEGPFPIVSSAGVTGSHSEYKVEAPGVVIGRTGTLGSVYWVAEPFWPLNTALWVKDFKGNDERFVSYLLKTVTMDGSTASAVPGVNRNHLHLLPVRHPTPQSQRRIAALLSGFDELIEINERRIELLEDLARSLYREWFVRFRFPGHEEVEWVDSEVGTIPAAWEVKTLGEVCSLVRSGSTPRRLDPTNWGGEGDIPWFKTGELQDGPLIAADEHLTITSGARLFGPGTILMAIYGSPTVGRLGWVTDKSSCNQAALGLRANFPDREQDWLWHQLIGLRDDLNAMAQGAAQQNISKEKVVSTRVGLPTAALLEAFTAKVEPARRLSHELSTANRRLAATRDLLLPRLVTGRLDIAAVSLGELLPAGAA